MSAWEYFNGDFDYTATPVGLIGCKIIICTASNKRKSWYQRGREGFSLGPAVQHYRSIQAIDSKTNILIIKDTAEYLHEYLTQPHVTAEDRMTHTIHFLSAALKDVPTSICDSQLAAIESVRTIFTNWQTLESLRTKKPTVLPLIPTQAVAPVRYLTPTSKGGQENQMAVTSKGVVQQKVLTIPKKSTSSNQLQGGPGAYHQPYQIKHRLSKLSDHPSNPNQKFTNSKEGEIPHSNTEAYYPLTPKSVFRTTSHAC